TLLHLVEDVAVVLRDAAAVLALGQTAALRRREEPPALDQPRDDLAIPDVVDGHGSDLEALLLHLEDDIDVLLAASAKAEEGEAETLTGAVDAVVAEGRESQRGAGGGGGLQEVSAADLI